jgi:hypothetical protein
MRRRAILLAAAFVLGMLFGASLPAQPHAAPSGFGIPSPDSTYTPEAVVDTVLAAVRITSGDSAAYAAVIFRAFSTPQTRLLIGTVNDYIDRLSTPELAPLLWHRKALHGPAHVAGDQAIVRVDIVAHAGERVAYLLSLLKQSAEPYAGCWLIDVVARLPPVGRKDKRAD